MGFPISHEVDGVQYIAVATGWGGGSIWRVPSFLTPDSRAATPSRLLAGSAGRILAPCHRDPPEDCS
jgi:hypothetical protein